MSVPQIKGWCPGALRPMQSGDGWVVRIRPFGGRLRQAQADGIATLAVAHGNGLLDLSARGNIQLRGISEDSHTPLIEGLRGLRLLDDDTASEGRRNIMVTPFWQAGDAAPALADALAKAMAVKGTPEIPGKFGFAIDTGELPVLQEASADIRFEKDGGGGLILIANGMSSGKPVTRGTAIPEAVQLAQWFLATRSGETRMADLINRIQPYEFLVPRQQQVYVPRPGATPQGVLVGLTFGQLRAETLAHLAKLGGLRLTPWRMMLVESARDLSRIEGIITNAADPLLRVVACVGAPRCAQGLGETHALARHLAPGVKTNELLHVSGCAKGCAHPRPATRTIVATTAGYNIIENGTASDAPMRMGLSKQSLTKAI